MLDKRRILGSTFLCLAYIQLGWISYWYILWLQPSSQLIMVSPIKILQCSWYLSYNDSLPTLKLDGGIFCAHFFLPCTLKFRRFYDFIRSKNKKTLFYPQHSPTQAHYGNRLLAGSTSADDAPRPYHVLAFFRLYPQKNLQRMPFRIVVLTTNLAKNSSMTSLNLCCLSLSILDRQSAWLRKPQVVICLTIERWSRLPVRGILKYCQTYPPISWEASLNFVRHNLKYC